MGTMKSILGTSGQLSAKKIKAPGPGLRWKLRNNLTWYFISGWLFRKMALGFSKLTGIITLTSELRAVLIRADGSMVNYGVVSRKLVTTAFTEFMVDNLITDTTEWGDFKFHDSGVGVTGAAIGDTDIETTDGESRATGTQVESTSEIYESVGTITYTTTKAITEHGLFSKATGTTLLDRHTFTAISVDNTDSIQFTFDFTVSSGG